MVVQDIDGQALLLLTLPTVQECMDLKLGPAIKLCHQIERVKVAFYKQFAWTGGLLPAAATLPQHIRSFLILFESVEAEAQRGRDDLSKDLFLYGLLCWSVKNYLISFFSQFVSVRLIGSLSI